MDENVMPTKGADAIEKARELLEGRLRELDAERAKIERALAEMKGDDAGRRRPGRPRGTRTRRGRPRGSKRADQALAAVNGNPGIAASEIAKKIGIKPNYVYRLMSDLEEEGKVRKEGRSYHPA